MALNVSVDHAGYAQAAELLGATGFDISAVGKGYGATPAVPCGEDIVSQWIAAQTAANLKIAGTGIASALADIEDISAAMGLFNSNVAAEGAAAAANLAGTNTALS